MRCALYNLAQHGSGEQQCFVLNSTHQLAVSMQG
jgi:hypothetical protein